MFLPHISSFLRYIFYCSCTVTHYILHTSPCSSTSHHIPTTYLIVFTLYISQCCFYIIHLTMYLIVFAIQMAQKSHCLSHHVNTTYLTVLLLIPISCLIAFTLRIIPDHYYVFSCVYTTYPIVTPHTPSLHHMPHITGPVLITYFTLLILCIRT